YDKLCNTHSPELGRWGVLKGVRRGSLPRTHKTGGNAVIASHRMTIAVAMTCLFIALPARAQTSQYFFETKPMFDNCIDGSLSLAQKDGITLGFSQNPPEAFLDEKTKEPGGIDWDINKAALDWMGVKNIKTEWMPWESQI